MATISRLGVNSQSGVYDLVQQYLNLEKTAYNRLQQQKRDLDQERAVMSDLGGELRSLRSALYDFRFPGVTNPINTFTTSSSDESVLTATAAGNAADANHTITVSALARAHSIASSAFDAGSESSLAGDHEFRIDQGEESYDVAVTIAAGASYETALQTVVDAVNRAGAPVSASFVRTDASGAQVRILLTSRSTGTAAAISAIKDSSGSLAEALGLAGTSSAETGYSLNTVQAPQDARFTVDGLEFVSSENRVTGALAGLTLQLQSVASSPVQLSVARDVEAIEGKVEEFVEAYNSLMTHVRDKTRGADQNGENRGIFAGNSLYTNLRGRMRSVLMSDVDGGAGQSEIKRLSQMGITATRDGTLAISDRDAFEEALRTRPDDVERLFTDEEQGLGVRTVRMLDSFVGAGGLLSQQTSSYRGRERALTERIAREEAYLARREEQLTDQLAGLQNMMAQLQRQQQILAIMSGNSNSNSG